MEQTVVPKEQLESESSREAVHIADEQDSDVPFPTRPQEAEATLFDWDHPPCHDALKETM